MNRLVHWLAATIAAIVIAAPQAANAQASWREGRTDKGCIYYMWAAQNWDGRLYGGLPVWDQPCKPGEPISGRGTLSFTYQNRYVAKYTGGMVNGAFNGNVEVLDPITVTPANDPRPRFISFQHGCFSFDGKSRSFYSDAGCQPRTGPAVAAQKQKPKVAPPPPSINGAGDCRCLQLTADEAGEILTNICAYPVVMSWCAEGATCETTSSTGGALLAPRGQSGQQAYRFALDHTRINNGQNTARNGRLPWRYAAVAAQRYDSLPQPRPAHIRQFESNGWFCARREPPEITWIVK